MKIICDGNSLTFGNGSTAGHDYPTVVGTLVTGAVITNKGVGGQTTAAMIADASTDIDPLFAAAAWVVCWEGTNDLFFGASAATAYSNLFSYCTSRRAVGFKVCIVTLLPRSDASTPGSFESDRQTVNTSLRMNRLSFADCIADVGGDPRIGDAGDQDDLTYYDGSHVHLNNAGYVIVATSVANAINSVLNASGVSRARMQLCM